MAQLELAAALDRAAAIMRKRPDLGPHEDMPARALWDGATRVSVAHDSGARIETDMPRELGGSGDRPTPGWLLRASTASCAVTRIAMAAAARGIELTAIEASVASRSDTRGLLGLPDVDGGAIPCAPLAMAMHIRVASDSMDAAGLRALVEESCALAPVQNALQSPVPFTLEIDVQGA